jgi:hypothetical protein
LISFYMIIITTTRQSMSSDEFIDLHQPYFCITVGLFFLIGQFSSPIMSFIMTLERYLAVVYCMEPHIRITMRMCYVAIVTVWGLSVSLAVSFMTSPQFSNRTDSMCLPLQNSDHIQVFRYKIVTTYNVCWRYWSRIVHPCNCLIWSYVSGF